MKYKNKITEIDGIKFHSKKEASRYLELKALERCGEITDLELQPKFPFIIEGFTEKDDKKIFTYIADFMYYPKGSTFPIIEDVKSNFTAKLPLFKLKQKLIEESYGFKISLII